MSEDAKEKGTSKQALRKKKGKKVTRKLLKHTDLFSLKLRACLNLEGLMVVVDVEKHETGIWRKLLFCSRASEGVCSGWHGFVLKVFDSTLSGGKQPRR